MYRQNDDRLPLKGPTRENNNKYTSLIEPRLYPSRPRTSSMIETRSSRKKTTGGKLTLMKFNKKKVEYKYFDNYIDP